LRHDDEQLVRYLSDRPGAPCFPDKYEGNWPEPPIAMMPPCTNPRLTAQRGMFVLFGLDHKGLECRVNWRKKKGKSAKESESRLIKFEIPEEHVEPMRNTLRWAGITPALLFPELTMMSTDILQGFVE
jgi:hypothetical protein